MHVSSPALAASLLASLSLAACAHAAAREQTSATAKQPAATAASAPAAPPPALAERTELPSVLREALSASMERHGEELTYLLATVMLLRYEDAEQLANMLADEPKLGRPAPGDEDSLNALLPEAFFSYQEQLSVRARAVAQAAHAQDDASLAKTFGALTETCVACHSAYLHDALGAAKINAL